MPFDIPILFLLFNRADQAEELIEHLRPLRPAKIYAHVDGPRAHKAGEDEQVKAVHRTLAEKIDWDCEVHTFFREKNVGLRVAITGALDWLFSNEETGIVLEDDCRPDLSFFPFCKELLERYAEDEQVMHIGANNLTDRFTENQKEDYLFTYYPNFWGWASWRRAWQKMDLSMAGLDDFAHSERFKKDILPKASARRYILDKFEGTRDGTIHSWAYAWYFSILKNKGLCITPKVHLSQNTGIGDPNATNTSNWDTRAERKARKLNFPLTHPKDKTVDSKLEVEIFHDMQKSRLRLYPYLVLRGLQRAAKGGKSRKGEKK